MSVVLGALLISLTGCFYYPRKVQFYDEECQIVSRKLVLAETGLSFAHVSCQNEGCLLALIPAAASAVVSGSIVVVGNVIYWLEKQGECRPSSPAVHGNHEPGPKPTQRQDR